MSAPYIISKGIDPFFAIGIGLAAAAVRINREEKEKGKTTQQSIESFQRRLKLAFGSDDTGKVVDEKKG